MEMLIVKVWRKLHFNDLLKKVSLFIIIDIFEQLSSSVLINLGRNTINMLIYHKIAAQDSKRSHGGGSQIGDMEGSGLIDVLDEEIYNFKS